MRGLSFFSCAIASIPLRCGIEMSATTTSGCSFLAAVTRARPSSAVPTNSKSSPRRRPNPSLTTRWSSANSTRGRLTRMLPQWHPGRDRRAAAGTAGDVDLAADQKCPLAHAGKAQARAIAMPRRIESGAVVADSEFQPAVEALQRDARLPRSRVTADVAQRFLRDTKHAERHVARQGFGNVAIIHLQSNRKRAREAPALGFQRLS